MGNSSYFEESGKYFHVTILKVDDCVVSKTRTIDKDGYNAIQLASIDTNKDFKSSKMQIEDALKPVPYW